MSDPVDGLPSYTSILPDQIYSNSDNTTASNIPISDFRRNEVRPILNDDGNCVFPLTVYLFFSFGFC